MEKQYKIAEIFYSVQGEGPWAGQPMVFVRFAGCNLKCSWCDTDFSYKYSLTREGLIANIKDVGGACRHVCFTGGEPSLQVDDLLVQHLHHLHGFRLHIETNGMFPVQSSDYFTSIVVSPKLPASAIPNWETVKSYWQTMLAFDIRAAKVSLKVVFDDCQSMGGGVLNVITGNHTFDLSGIIKDWEDVGGHGWGQKFIQPLEVEGYTNISKVIEFVLANPQWRISEQGHKRWGMR